MAARPEGRLPALAGLRFAAAVAILLFHHGGPLLAWAPAWLERVRTGGYAWVGLFYVLSGFVLARAFPAPLAPAERRTFWAARLARLYPAYLLAFVLAAPFALDRWSGGGATGTAKAALVAAASLLLVQAWIPPIARLWNAPGWSTSVVLFFYATFPWLAAGLGRLRTRALWAALAGAWVASLAAPLLWLALQPDGPVADPTWDEPPWLLALKFHPLARAGEFVAGVALGLLHARGLRLGRTASIVLGPLALAAAVALLASGRIPYPLLHNGVLVPLHAVLILALAPGAGPLPAVLGSRPARSLGDASFALYALQEPLWEWVRFLGGDRLGEPTPQLVLAWAALSIAVAVLVSRGLERPARRALRPLTAPPAPGRAAAAGGRRPAPVGPAPVPEPRPPPP